MSSVRYIKPLFFLAFLFCFGAMRGQTFQFEHYSTARGINFPFVYTIQQDLNGYLLIGTGDGLYRFDGFNFVPFYKKHGLAENFVLSSCKSEDGTIWFGHNNGSVTSYDGANFKAFDLSLFTSSRINAVDTDSSGVVWAASQNDGLVKIVEGRSPKSYYKDLKGKLIYDLICVGRAILLATDEGLILATETSDTGDTFDLEYVDGSPFGVTSLDMGEDGLIIAGTEDEGVYYSSSTSPKMSFSQINPTLELQNYKISDVRIDKSKNIWISTMGNSLIELPFESNKYRRMIDLGVDQQLSENVKTTFEDREGNLWIGTFGNGLSKLVDNHFAHFSFWDSEENKMEVHSFFSKGDSIWIGTNRGILFSLERPNNIQADQPFNGLPEDSITSILTDQEGRLWASSSHYGIYVQEKRGQDFESVPLSTDKLSDYVTATAYLDSMLYVGTKNGLYLVNVKDRGIKKLTNRDGLLHNRIRAIYIDKAGTIWIGSEGNGINFIKEGKVGVRQLYDGRQMFIVTSLTADQKGRIWAGTEGAGVLKLSEEDNIISNNEGLYSNYIKAVHADESNYLWITHTGGISRIDLQSDLIETFGQDKGLGQRFNDQAIFSDQKDIIWIGSSTGLTKYDRSRDLVNLMEPVVNILSTQIGDSIYPYSNALELPSGSYKVKFDFIGISHRNSGNVSYSYILEGHDLDWSEPSTSREAQYTRVDPGEYTFRVKAFNADGHGGETERTMQVAIAIPFYKKGWFYGLLALVIFGVVRYIVFQREKYLRQNQEILQSKLDERTKEVVEQKELLEVKNKDITSSIEYAKSIQNAMLPNEEKLDALFHEAFVYFKPRDIVSGDFYWIDEYGDKVILACADCTGHGVPGAFMSLIGSALLKEVCNMKNVHTPNAVLKMLNEELNNMVNHHESEFGIADGMDISVIEFDRSTNTLRCSSARRPVVVYRNGERIELKGDRYSIGGVESRDKSFSMHSIELQKGDVFYMFSDGVSDQFGGPKGKKFKKKRVIEMLDNFFSQSMKSQRTHLAAHIREWKSHHEQVDDMIFLGVRV